MSENRIHKEPSTEEILGSIRRIITEDNAQARGADAADAGAEARVPTDDMATDEIEAATETPVDAAPVQAAAEEQTTEDDEILDLTEEIGVGDTTPDPAPETDDQPENPTAEELADQSAEEPADQSAEEPEGARREPRFGLSATPAYGDGGEDGEDVRREPVIGIQPSEPADEDPQPADAPDPTGEVASPLQGYNYSPQVLSSSRNTAGQEEDAMESTGQEEPEAPESADTAATGEPTAEDGGVAEEIVSATATAATAAALGDLNRAVSEKTGKLKLGGETTVAEIVKEMLRPMLREWLDENLPLIVDRVVRREIQKLVDRAQDDD